MLSKPHSRVTGPVAFGVVILAGLAVGIVAGMGMAALHDGEQNVGLLRFSGLSIGAMAIVLAIGIWWWRLIDEAAREAHKWAWWWGGSTAMGLAAAVIVALGYVRDVVPEPLLSASPEHLLVSGGLFVILCEIVGYTVAWCVWWLRRM